LASDLAVGRLIPLLPLITLRFQRLQVPLGLQPAFVQFPFHVILGQHLQYPHRFTKPRMLFQFDRQGICVQPASLLGEVQPKVQSRYEFRQSLIELGDLDHMDHQVLRQTDLTAIVNVGTGRRRRAAD
jgi:hypothetical protein